MFYFHPYWGEMIQFDEHIFQMGWFNHQPENRCSACKAQLYFVVQSEIDLQARSKFRWKWKKRLSAMKLERAC